MKLRQFREVTWTFYHFVGEAFRMAVAVWKLAKLPEPRVSVFGGSKMRQDSIYAEKAMVLVKKLVAKNIAIISGGGPGIMEAACTASQTPNGEYRSIAISIEGLRVREGVPSCKQQILYMNYFWSRKWLLTNYSQAFVVFPGGFGTMNELSEISTLIETAQLLPHPIVLIGVEYWKPFMEQVEMALREHLLKQKDRDLIVLTDDIDKAIDIVSKRCEDVKACRVAMGR